VKSAFDLCSVEEAEERRADGVNGGADVKEEPGSWRTEEEADEEEEGYSVSSVAGVRAVAGEVVAGREAGVTEDDMWRDARRRRIK